MDPTQAPPAPAAEPAGQTGRVASAARSKAGDSQRSLKDTSSGAAPNPVPDKQKSAKGKGSSEQAAGQSKAGEPAEQSKQAQPKQADTKLKAALTSTAASPSAAQGIARTGPSPQPGAASQPAPSSHNAARDLRPEAQASQAQSQVQSPAQQQQQQKQGQQQQRHAPAAQPGARPTPPPANPPPTRTATTGRGSARHATNYSAAVSGMVQNTAALNLTDSAEGSSPAQPDGLASGHPLAAEQASKPAAATAATTSAAPTTSQAHTRRQQQQAQQQAQQQGRQQQQHKQQQQQQASQQHMLSGLAAMDAHAGMPQFSQRQQQPSFVPQHASISRGNAQYPWDVPLPTVCTPHQAPHLPMPNVDWSFQAPAGAAPPSTAPVFPRTASAGNLANLTAWPQHGTGPMPPPIHAVATTRGESFDGAAQQSMPGGQQSQQAGNRATTSGFVVASSPGRPGQNGNRAGQPSGSVRPSAGILSVQMNTAGQSRPAGSHAQPAAGTPQQNGAQVPPQAPYSGMGSAGQSVGVSLPSSMANNIWAVGEGNSDSQGTSAEQRPHLWASPSRNSPLRRAGAYNGPGAARQPSLSQATEIRRVAEASGLCCPITKDLMSDPVVLISDGYTYERAAITKWLERNETSPITKAPLQHKDMVPNLTMRSAIQLLIPSANSQRLFPSQLERRHI